MISWLKMGGMTTTRRCMCNEETILTNILVVGVLVEVLDDEIRVLDEFIPGFANTLEALQRFHRESAKNVGEHICGDVHHVFSFFLSCPILLKK